MTDGNIVVGRGLIRAYASHYSATGFLDSDLSCIDEADQVSYFMSGLEAKIRELNDNGFTSMLTWDQFPCLYSDVDRNYRPSI